MIRSPTANGEARGAGVAPGRAAAIDADDGRSDDRGGRAVDGSTLGTRVKDEANKAGDSWGNGNAPAMQRDHACFNGSLFDLLHVSPAEQNSADATSLRIKSFDQRKSSFVPSFVTLVATDCDSRMSDWPPHPVLFGHRRTTAGAQPPDQSLAKDSQQPTFDDVRLNPHVEQPTTRLRRPPCMECGQHLMSGE